ncbi:TPR end-of-group domain-containing protein [Ktedonospora formicarum]|uniref:DinB-like domain-containing protein n=1 Tax=Ktedonospora formicarum TaxID=2778364 RepID=A0A8J3MTC5_9CHLR|nr:DinB family protein [Ktedonospora formicarum]GHO48087.1 hypothetical protein KSX_62500 [Ktedonospora formicarum]
MVAHSYKALILDLLSQGHHEAEVFVQELSESERNAVGTSELWSAKDHFVHRTFWHRDLIHQIRSFQSHQEMPPREKSAEELNEMVFEDQRYRPWSEVYTESEQTYAELIALYEELSEEDLTNPERFASITGGSPLYRDFLNGCYEHDQEHLVQYYADRNDLLRAIQIRERCAERVLQSDLPEWSKGDFLYNLACFYAKLNPYTKANALLQEAIALNPNLEEHAKSDPDLAALRKQ